MNKINAFTYFISYDNSYFKEKEHHLNTMVNVRGLPTLFITLSIADSKWIYLTAMLIMVIRSLIIFRFMYVRISYSVIVHWKRDYWNNRRLSGCKSIFDFFERIEFQNLGAVDLHIAFATIEELITSNEIYSTILIPETELELKTVKSDSLERYLFYFSLLTKKTERILFFFNLQFVACCLTFSSLLSSRYTPLFDNLLVNETRQYDLLSDN
jgi:hypothetical protein